MQEAWVWSLGQEDPLEKSMATHSSILARRIPKTEEPGELQSQCSKRVGQDLVTNIFTSYTHKLKERRQYPHRPHGCCGQGHSDPPSGLWEAGFAVSRGQEAPWFPQEDAIVLFFNNPTGCQETTTHQE